jgi:hypothetical protein
VKSTLCIFVIEFAADARGDDLRVASFSRGRDTFRPALVFVGDTHEISVMEFDDSVRVLFGREGNQS